MQIKVIVPPKPARRRARAGAISTGALGGAAGAVAARVGQTVAVGRTATLAAAHGADDADEATLLKATQADRVGADLRGGDALATRLGLTNGDKNGQEAAGSTGLSNVRHG